MAAFPRKHCLSRRPGYGVGPPQEVHRPSQQRAGRQPGMALSDVPRRSPARAWQRMTPLLPRGIEPRLISSFARRVITSRASAAVMVPVTLVRGRAMAAGVRVLLSPIPGSPALQSSPVKSVSGSPRNWPTCCADRCLSHGNTGGSRRNASVGCAAALGAVRRYGCLRRRGACARACAGAASAWPLRCGSARRRWPWWRTDPSGSCAGGRRRWQAALRA